MRSGARGWRRSSSSATMPVSSPTASPATVSIVCGKTIDSQSSGTWRYRYGSSHTGSTRASGGPICIASLPLSRTSTAPHSSTKHDLNVHLRFSLLRAAAHGGRLAGQLELLAGVRDLGAVDLEDGDVAVGVVADVEILAVGTPHDALG